ncbi:hypothetical protein KUTeg_015816 [Tegillarca granosa]|uniref:NADH dehydrogenase subunit 4L n=1 Tax=Tegillarca granosa TaxID=220873 RepID=A0ABQ9EJ40_TEGGR|nr:hypothetical protein KUTeg_015816 [Tegillarca granosa]
MYILSFFFSCSLSLYICFARSSHRSFCVDSYICCVLGVLICVLLLVMTCCVSSVLFLCSIDDVDSLCSFCVVMCSLCVQCLMHCDFHFVLTCQIDGLDSSFWCVVM